jgi:Ribosome-associated heat shock protein implicated in the recycling of the 50S subunit (S4 paralog)
MRIDKYLKVSRIIKRRTVAKELLDSGNVTLNQQRAKASAVVEIGDTISIKYGAKMITLQVTNIQEIVRKEEASSMYQLLQETVI